ncbi:MAG: helix-turn-helix domain-containing protein [Synergistes sp.]|nr:helix-turn-helix domain-containing protein [Synergistes sp.]
MKNIETKLDYLIELLEVQRSGLKRFLTKEEAAEYLGMSAYTLDIYQREGKLQIPSIKIGKLVRYDLKDVDRYMDSMPRREQLNYKGGRANA